MTSLAMCVGRVDTFLFVLRRYDLTVAEQPT
jgi:hypothetical protein